MDTCVNITLSYNFSNFLAPEACLMFHVGQLDSVFLHLVRTKRRYEEKKLQNSASFDPGADVINKILGTVATQR